MLWSDPRCHLPLTYRFKTHLGWPLMEILLIRPFHPRQRFKQNDPEISQWEDELNPLTVARQRIRDRLFDQHLNKMLPICDVIVNCASIWLTSEFFLLSPLLLSPSRRVSEHSSKSKHEPEVDLYSPFAKLSNRALDRLVRCLSMCLNLSPR